MVNRSAKRDAPHGKDHEHPRLYAENTTTGRSQEKLSTIYIDLGIRALYSIGITH